MTPVAAIRLAVSRATLGSPSTRGAEATASSRRQWSYSQPLSWSLFLRRPTTMTVAEFWADDGPIFNRALERGVAMLLEQSGGSLVLVQGSVVLSET